LEEAMNLQQDSLGKEWIYTERLCDIQFHFNISVKISHSYKEEVN
jgi:hypothetical protein